ncbi:MAG: HAD-IIIA family hydrolase [Bacteriovoracaceae bacterium]|nr:HAD-IIIA family hydrolase [Bacteriovoracaceae bacterium]
MRNNAAVFFDRDGVLIEDTHLPSHIGDIKYIDGAARVLTTLKRRGFKIILVTNQTVVSRGILSLEAAMDLNSQILDNICSPQKGDELFDGIYLCPFHPNAQIDEFRLDSPLRKPRPGMLFKAQQDLGIELTRSYLVGDRISDIIAGNLAGCKTVWLKTAKANEALIKTELEIDEADKKPDFEINQLEELLACVGGGE